jgi:hypothetical protein
MTDTDSSSASSQLQGRWSKVGGDACADKYPASITFSASTYRGARGAGQGFIWWDAGTYRIDHPHTLTLAVANDEMIPYAIEFRGDEFDVTDADGCRVTYRRAAVIT